MIETLKTLDSETIAEQERVKFVVEVLQTPKKHVSYKGFASTANTKRFVGARFDPWFKGEDEGDDESNEDLEGETVEGNNEDVVDHIDKSTGKRRPSSISVQDHKQLGVMCAPCTGDMGISCRLEAQQTREEYLSLDDTSTYVFVSFEVPFRCPLDDRTSEAARVNTGLCRAHAISVAHNLRHGLHSRRTVVILAEAGSWSASLLDRRDFSIAALKMIQAVESCTQLMLLAEQILYSSVIFVPATQYTAHSKKKPLPRPHP